MSSPQPQRAPKRQRHGSDHRIVVRSDPHHQPDMRLLAEALMLHANEQAAKAKGSPVPHLAGMQKLAGLRPDNNPSTSEEGDGE